MPLIYLRTYLEIKNILSYCYNTKLYQRINILLKFSLECKRKSDETREIKKRKIRLYFLTLKSNESIRNERAEITTFFLYGCIVKKESKI